jgi:hypothetical protein
MANDTLGHMRDHSVSVRYEALLLVLAVAHVFCYAVLVPPWQHYDEPASLEYALMIRELGRVPAYDEEDTALRHMIAASIVHSPLFGPSATDPTGSPQVSLGFNQRVHPPLYYAIIAIATIPVAHQPIERQLMIARLASVAIAALCIYAVIRILRLLLIQSELRLFALGVLACLPPFADLMSAVNSDVLAHTVAVLLFGSAAWLLIRPHRQQMLLAGLLVLLAPNVKRILVVPALLLLLLLLVIWLRRRGWRTRRFVTILGVVAASGILLLSACWILLPQMPIAWQSLSGDVAVLDDTHAAVGQRSFRLERPPTQAGPSLRQELPLQFVQEARGHMVNLSALMRADAPGLMALEPVLQIDQQLVMSTVIANTEWNFVSMSAYIPPTAKSIAVWLNGPFSAGRVFYDEITLVTDSAPAQGAPDGTLERGLILNSEPRNLLRNPGAERTLPAIERFLPTALQQQIARPSLEWASDKTFYWGWISAAYPLQFVELFRGFWGTFSWGERTMQGGWLTSIAVLVAAAMLGALGFSVRLGISGGRSAVIHANLWWLALATVLITWAIALARVALQPVPGVLILGFGRYTYPALLPALIVFTVGSAMIFPASLRRQGLVGLSFFLTTYAFVALGTLLQ